MLFIPSITDWIGLDLPPWVPALTGLAFPLFFLISFIKQRSNNKSDGPESKMSVDKKKEFKDIESGPGRGPNIKY